MSVPTVTVAILAFGPEPWLLECVESVVNSVGVVVDVVVVDNGTTSPALAEVRAWPSVTVLRPGTNLGFAAGVHYAVRGRTNEFLALLNSDTAVAPNALIELCTEAARQDVGIASGCLVLADRVDVINSAGNPVHLLGFSWAGGFGSARLECDVARDIASATGACAVMRTSWWNELGGFAPAYFAYYEDVELSWRTWQRGRRVQYVPSAVIHHHYDFFRSAAKMYLLERNRLLFVLTCYERRTLLLLAPLLVSAEVGILIWAIKRGWWRAKLAGWHWIIGHVRWLRARRKQIQRERILGDAELAKLWTTRFDMDAQAVGDSPRVLDGPITAYWFVVHPHLRRRGGDVRVS